MFGMWNVYSVLYEIDVILLFDQKLPISYNYITE